jgi:hypothetical protein
MNLDALWHDLERRVQRGSAALAGAGGSPRRSRRSRPAPVALSGPARSRGSGGAGRSRTDGSLVIVPLALACARPCSRAQRCGCDAKRMSCSSAFTTPGAVRPGDADARHQPEPRWGRVHTVGGRVEITSAPCRGTTVAGVIRWPPRAAWPRPGLSSIAQRPSRRRSDPRPVPRRSERAPSPTARSLHVMGQQGSRRPFIDPTPPLIDDRAARLRFAWTRSSSVRRSGRSQGTEAVAQSGGGVTSLFISPTRRRARADCRPRVSVAAAASLRFDLHVIRTRAVLRSTVLLWGHPATSGQDGTALEVSPTRAVCATASTSTRRPPARDRLRPRFCIPGRAAAMPSLLTSMRVGNLRPWSCMDDALLHLVAARSDPRPREGPTRRAAAMVVAGAAVLAGSRLGASPTPEEGSCASCCSMPPAAVAHRRRCRSSTLAGRRATRECATPRIRRQSRRS